MTPAIPESSPRIGTILRRIYLSLQLCVPIYIFTVIFAATYTTGVFLPTLGVVVTASFGTTVAIITQRDHIRRLTTQLRLGASPLEPLEGGEATGPSPPALCSVGVIAWCLACVAAWVLEVGLVIFSIIVLIVEGAAQPSVVVLGVLHGSFAAGQLGLLFSIAMLCIEERKRLSRIALPTSSEEEVDAR